MFQYQIEKVLLGHYDGASTGVVVPLEFKHITIDAGRFLTKFLGPILDAAWEVIGPVKPVLDFLADPLPGVSTLVGRPVSLVDWVQLIGGRDPRIQAVVSAVEMIDKVSDLIQSIHNMSSGGTLLIDFGDYTFGQPTAGPHVPAAPAGVSFDPCKTSLSSVDVTSAKASATQVLTLGSNNSAQNALAKATQFPNNGSSTTKGSFDLPILTNPMAALQILTGHIDNIDLFTWQWPVFTFTKSLHWHFPIVGVPGINIGADIGIGLGAALNINIGYDTHGIAEFMQSKYPLFLADGFYVDDSVPQVRVDLSISMGALLDLTLIRAGVFGTLHGEIDMKLYDPNHDGRVRISEIISTLEHDPLEMFVFHGEIDITISAFLWIGIDLGFLGTITIIDLEFNIIGPLTLVEFSTEPSPTPTLATSDSSTGAVTLNTGKLAGDRLLGNTSDAGGTFAISGNHGDSFNVSYNGAMQHFDHAKKLVLDLADGNSNITISDIDIPVVITRDDGNNIIHLGGGNDVVVAGSGNNIIDGTSGNKKITVGAGNNIIIGGTGDDTSLAGSAFSTGTNTIFGGVATSYLGSTLTANAAVAGRSNDITVYGKGQSIVFGGSGTDKISIKGGTGSDTLRGGNGRDLMIGDQGHIEWNNDGTRRFATTLDDAPGPSAG